MDKTIPESWGLGLPELEKIYRVEVEQADKLRQATAAERKPLYSFVYQEYFQKLPFHPQLTIKQNQSAKQGRVDYQLQQILPFIKGKQRFMEIGAGDCSLSIAASNYCREIVALEVSKEVAENSNLPENVKLILFDGFNIPLEDSSVDVAYSNQLMEHLHPDDAAEQLKSIYRVLQKGGAYICITPNRISGPHDISRFFIDKPVGFHLKEYSAGDLRSLFMQVGFQQVIAYTILKGRKVELPFFLVKMIEQMAEGMSEKAKEKFLNFRPVQIIFNAVIAAIK
ncbi:MAG: class I SAM-dependent methyltransferase [Bacteroidota bacterium]